MGNAERQRLDEADTRGVPWRRWAPYLSERQWRTVREDYGGGHDTWSAFTHEQARSRAYRWGEDGLAGICDDRQLLCLALVLWNGRDPILKERNPAYVEQAQSLLENLFWICAVTNHVGTGAIGLWDEADGFFYDVLRRPDGSSVLLKVRSIVGLMPLAAATVFSSQIRSDFPQIVAGAAEFFAHHPAVLAAMPGCGRQVAATGPALFALFDETRLRRILARMLDEQEFLEPHGIRAVSRYHAVHPYILEMEGQEYRVGYLPAESDTGMSGGNSNWRGPVWFPINIMLVRALLNLYVFFGDQFTIECPTGSGNEYTLHEVAREISDRLTGTFFRGADGRRPVHGGQPILQNDPHWRDLLLFYEYFHGDNGAGIGASHQTGWTGTVALLLPPLLLRGMNAEALRAMGSAAAAGGVPRQPAAGRRPGGSR